MKCYRVKVYYDDSPKRKSRWGTATYCGCIPADSRLTAIASIRREEANDQPKRKIHKITARPFPVGHICTAGN